ncbi:hypothetical protein ACOMHN_043597 [Nucella lapillus]
MSYKYYHETLESPRRMDLRKRILTGYTPHFQPLSGWPRGGLTLVAPCGLLALRLRRNGPVCGCDGGVEMSGVGAAELASCSG